MELTTSRQFESLIRKVRGCTICAKDLPLGPRPVFQAGIEARILIAGQAPGKKVHETGITFNDPSGKRLRQWLGVDRSVFHDPEQFAILPMGFCFPGTGKSGDLPPRPECAPAWRTSLLEHLQQIECTIVLGQYAHDWYFNDGKMSVTERVRSWSTYWPELLPLPHPSPRNNLWLRRNPWFEKEVLPILQQRIRETLKP